MPGADKTTAAAALQRQGWPVIGEYTSSDRDHCRGQQAS
jgi:hypothetical protein